ncbi:MAG: transporter substrate-binding domain-containing protein [Desulfatirhabdiaceae bacterium]
MMQITADQPFLPVFLAFVETIFTLTLASKELFLHMCRVVMPAKGLIEIRYNQDLFLSDSLTKGEKSVNLTKIFVFGLFLLLACGSLDAETLNIAVHEFCPYLCEPAKENGKEGYVVAVLKAVYEPEGYKLKFHRVSYVQGIRDTEQGRYDGMPMLNSRSSKKIVLSEEPCGTLIQNFYVKKGDPWKYEGIKSLENIHVGSIHGYNYASLDPEYDAYLQKFSNTNPKKVFYADTETPSLTNLTMILEGKITTFNECSYLVDYISLKEGLTGKFGIAGNLGTLENYMGISPKRPDARKLAEIFNQGIKKLRNTGQLNTILSGYGLMDWEK